MREQIDTATRVAPLVALPGDDFDELPTNDLLSGLTPPQRRAQERIDGHEPTSCYSQDGSLDPGA